MSRRCNPLRGGPRIGIEDAVERSSQNSNLSLVRLEVPLASNPLLQQIPPPSARTCNDRDCTLPGEGCTLASAVAYRVRSKSRRTPISDHRT